MLLGGSRNRSPQTACSAVMLVVLLQVCLLSAITPCMAAATSGASTLGVGNRGLTTTPNDKRYKLMFMNGGSSFFEPIAEGFLKTCLVLGVDFVYAGPVWDSINATISQAGPGNSHIEHPDACGDKLKVLRSALALAAEDGGIDGIVMKPSCNETFATQLAQEAHDANVPLVFVDSDFPASRRLAYIGTNNEFLGRTMARLLKQLRPEGGTFTMVGKKQGRYEGFYDEITKENNNPKKAHWQEVGSEFDDLCCYESGDDRWWFELTNKAALVPTAMVALVQSPMRHPNWTMFMDEYNSDRKTTMIGVDGADYQLEYLNRLYVDGLVGQLPYQIGAKSVEVLLKIVQGRARDPNFQLDQTIFTTNVVSYNLIPVELPELQLNQNLLGDLKYIGLVCFAVVAAAALGCMIWVIVNRNAPVVKMAQPFFLIMVAVGVLIVASALIPLSYDDNGTNLNENVSLLEEDETTTFTTEAAGEEEIKGDEDKASTKDIAICMSIPWLAFVGFTLTFSALFSKTWRVNQLFHHSHNARRMQVAITDVMAPFCILMMCNLIVLICWTVLDPLTYSRQFKSGTDFWNREIESYGACQSDNAVAYLVPLILFNLGVLAITCWQAFETRDISSNFAESKSIGLSLGSILQTFLTGVPVIAVVRDMPIAFYLVLTFVIFLLSAVLLMFIFVPKMNIHRKFAHMSEPEQRKMINDSIRQPATDSSLGPSSSGLLDLSGPFQNIKASSYNNELQVVQEHAGEIPPIQFDSCAVQPPSSLQTDLETTDQ